MASHCLKSWLEPAAVVGDCRKLMALASQCQRPRLQLLTVFDRSGWLASRCQESRSKPATVVGVSRQLGGGGNAVPGTLRYTAVVGRIGRRGALACWSQVLPVLLDDKVAGVGW